MTPDGPGPTWLSTAFNELSAAGGYWASQRPGEFNFGPAAGISADSAEVLAFWSPWISRCWYWSSPSAMIECPKCGDLRFVGKRSTKACRRSRKLDDGTHIQCPGKLTPIEPPLDPESPLNGKRPRRKTKKLPTGN